MGQAQTNRPGNGRVAVRIPEKIITNLTCKHCGQPIMWINDAMRLGWIHCGEAGIRFSCESMTFAEPFELEEK